jgi:hypothetical protein
MLFQTNKLGLACLVSASALLALGLNAQDNKESEEDQVFELSPFTVTESADGGYYASSTLAGTRIKADIKDLGASIQILTEEFMEDVGADSAEDLLLYTSGTEAGGLSGNFSGGTVGFGDGSTVDVGELQNEPHKALRVRGMGRPDLTRDYFLTDIPLNSYNTTRVTISSGANGILFGLGSPAGIVNNSLSKANLRKNSSRLNFRIRSTGMGEDLSLSGKADFNMVLVKNKLAVRLALLEQDTNYVQQPTYRRDSRQYITMTAKPWKGATLRASAELGDMKANNPDPTGPLENWSRYLHVRDLVREANGGANLPVVYNPVAYARKEDQPHFPEGQVDFIWDGVIPNKSWVQAPNLTTTLSFVYDGSVDGIAFGIMPNIGKNVTKTISFFDTVDGSNPRDSDILSVENVGRTDKNSGWRFQGLSDLDLFNFNRTFIGGHNPFQNRDFEAYNVTFEQLMLDGDFGIELAFDNQTYHRESFNAYKGSRTPFRVDFATHLPDGRENPNFGRPYLVSTSQKTVLDRLTERTAMRATAFYELDFEDFMGDDSLLARIFGHHKFSGLYTYQEKDTYDTDMGEGFFGDASLNLDGIIGNNPFKRTTSIISYIGPPIDLLSDPAGLTFSDLVINRDDILSNRFALAPGTTVPNVSYADKFAGTLREEPIDREFYVQDARLALTEVESYAFVWQGYLFGGHIVPTVGWRKDKSTEWTRDADLYRLQQSVGILEPGRELDVIEGIAANVEPQYFNLDYSYDLTNGDQLEIVPEVVEGENTSWGVVAHWPESIFPLPKGMDLSFHYNTSQNFVPDSSRIDQYGNTISNPEGTTKDYGFRLGLFDGKFNVRVNWYEAKIQNEQSNRVGSLFNKSVTQMTGIILDELIVDLREMDPTEVDGEGNLVNPRYYEMLDALDTMGEFFGFELDFQNAQINYDDSNPNAAIMQLAQANFDMPLDPDAVPDHPIVGDVLGFSMPFINNLTDTQDVSSEGLSVRLTWNVTRNWRLHMNVAKSETMVDNSIPRVINWVDTYRSEILGTMTNPLFVGGFDRNNPAGPAPENENNSFAGWYQGIVNTMNRLTAFDGLPNPEVRKWRVNFVSRYKFNEGFLDGFSVNGTIRWQDNVSIGTGIEETPDGPIPDLSKLYFGPEQTTVGLGVSYRRKIWNNVNWSISFNVQNLFYDEDEMIPIVAQPDGTIAEVRVSQPRTYTLSTSFKW